MNIRAKLSDGNVIKRQNISKELHINYNIATNRILLNFLKSCQNVLITYSVKMLAEKLA